MFCPYSATNQFEMGNHGQLVTNGNLILRRPSAINEQSIPSAPGDFDMTVVSGVQLRLPTRGSLNDERSLVTLTDGLGHSIEWRPSHTLKVGSSAIPSSTPDTSALVRPISTGVSSNIADGQGQEMGWWSGVLDRLMAQSSRHAKGWAENQTCEHDCYVCSRHSV